MENRRSLNIITSLVAVFVIMSLFSGIAAAADSSKERYDNSKEQYQILKDRYDDAKKNYQETKDRFNAAKKKFKSERTNLSRDELKDRTREYLLKSIDYMVTHLEILKNRVNADKEYIPFDVVANIDTHITQLNYIKAKVQVANTTQELADAARQLDDNWIKMQLEARYYVGLIVNHRIDQFIVKADNASARMDTLIQKLKDQGKDVTNLEGYASSFDSFVSEAKTNHQNEVTLYGTHSGIDDNGLVTNNQEAKEFLQQATASQKDTVRKLKSASEEFRNFFKEAKKITPGKVVLRGTGRLEANGTGNARIKGNLTVTVSGNATLTVSNNAEVTTDGTGTREDLAKEDVKYQGFGQATVTGEDIRIEISGDNIVLTAEGTGSAVLRGKGMYRVEKEFTVSGEWSKKVD